MNHNPEQCAVCAPEWEKMRKDMLIWGENLGDYSGEHVRHVPVRPVPVDEATVLDWPPDLQPVDTSRCQHHIDGFADAWQCALSFGHAGEHEYEEMEP